MSSRNNKFVQPEMLRENLHATGIGARIYDGTIKAEAKYKAMMEKALFTIYQKDSKLLTESLKSSNGNHRK